MWKYTDEVCLKFYFHHVCCIAPKNIVLIQAFRDDGVRQGAFWFVKSLPLFSLAFLREIITLTFSRIESLDLLFRKIRARFSNCAIFILWRTKFEYKYFPNIFTNVSLSINCKCIWEREKGNGKNLKVTNAVVHWFRLCLHLVVIFLHTHHIFFIRLVRILERWRFFLDFFALCLFCCCFCWIRFNTF